MRRRLLRQGRRTLYLRRLEVTMDLLGLRHEAHDQTAVVDQGMYDDGVKTSQTVCAVGIEAGL